MELPSLHDTSDHTTSGNHGPNHDSRNGLPGINGTSGSVYRDSYVEGTSETC
jgi:hypothetical protein